MPKTFGQKHTLNQSGLTLIELLIAIAILLLVFALVIFSLRTFGQQIESDSNGQNILSTLRLARSKTLASEGDTTYGVHFETGKYVLFSGSTYVNANPSNKVFNLVDSEIYAISLNGGPTNQDVVFDRVRGTTSDFGTVSIRLTADNNQSKTIHISSSGQVSYAEALTTSDTRKKDSRHLHFNLGSIQGSNTLTLEFPSESVIQNIPMSGYFDGTTSFDWSDTIVVDGTPQVLRVHTHFLDGSNTTLCIHRDDRYNDKALNIKIDGITIVTYTPSGAASAGIAQ